MAEIEWRTWREVSDGCLLRAIESTVQLDCFLHVVERVNVGGITSMGKVHEVERNGQKVVRPIIADDAEVYLIDLLGPEVLPWPMPVSRADLARRAEVEMREAQEILDDAKATLAGAQQGFVEACKGLEIARAKVLRLKGGW
jgi:hypothetical protein